MHKSIVKGSTLLFDTDCKFLYVYFLLYYKLFHIGFPDIQLISMYVYSSYI